MPSAGRPKAALQPNQDGSVTIQYVPTQSGVHELNVSYNDAPVEGWLLCSMILLLSLSEADDSPEIGDIKTAGCTVIRPKNSKLVPEK